MGQLIDGLLLLSGVTRKELQLSPVRLDGIARHVLEHLREAQPEREVEWTIAEPMEALSDPQLMESLFENLLGNAWKFTAFVCPAQVQVGQTARDGVPVFFVRDNGAGFRMEYVSKLFVPFQRLHSDREFSGTGIGLATTQRIVHRHGGTIWAESDTGRGATFYFTLAPSDGLASCQRVGGLD
jgi:light-regulated signal transduction histidine kinase (bacteriophytochrome)